MSIIIKQEELSSLYDEVASTVGQEYYDLDQRSLVSASNESQSIFRAPTEIFRHYVMTPKNDVNDNATKKEERPVIHRNNGRISIENFRRRRQLSQVGSEASPRSENGPNQMPGRSNMLPPTQTPGRRSYQASFEQMATPSSFRRTTFLEIVPDIAMDESKDDLQDAIQQQQLQQQQQQLQQQQLQQRQLQQPLLDQAIIQVTGTAYCFICQQRYKTRQGLKKHEKTKKHADNLAQVQRAAQMNSS